MVASTVGKEQFSTHGAHGAQKHLRTRHFYTFAEAREYLKGEGCWICGVEIVTGATAVQSKPFRGSTAFVIGNEVSS